MYANLTAFSPIRRSFHLAFAIYEPGSIRAGSALATLVEEEAGAGGMDDLRSLVSTSVRRSARPSRVAAISASASKTHWSARL
jgi:hypothetical protein